MAVGNTKSPTPALAWLPPDGSWRPEPRDEPELSAVVAMLSAFSNETGACEPLWRPGVGWGWRLTEKGLAMGREKA